MTPLTILPVLVVAVVLLIRAELRGERRRIYVFKPLSTTLVIAVAALGARTPGANAGYAAGVLAGLVLSLGGDVALMFPSARAFLVGLILFLLAHVAYTITFTLFNGVHAADLISGGVLLAIAVAFFRYVGSGLGKMKVPVIAYVLIICLMVNRAISTLFGTSLTSRQAWLVATGASLFCISDLMLAVNRFGRPFKYHRISLAFYYGGQLLIALSPAQF
jgi:uncharacterized membrane protein YhhN